MDVQVGDIIQVKKPHPCQNYEFSVLRVGMDFKIRCTKCGREKGAGEAKTGALHGNVRRTGFVFL